MPLCKNRPLLPESTTPVDSKVRASYSKGKVPAAGYCINSIADRHSVGKKPNTEAQKPDSKTRNRKCNEPDTPPCFTINMSLPPEQRYTELATAFKPEMQGLTSLFDEVVGDSILPNIPIDRIKFVSKLLLRRVYSSEETAELRGIAKVTGIEIYLLVCFNVLLDLFMGCSSGGALVRASSDPSDEGTKMVHFRTLDWNMPALRKIVVCLEYVASAGLPVFATSITYAGFVGVLTGVRQGLSLSLNFRPTHDDSHVAGANIKYRCHQLLVLLGWRPSIASVLRNTLLATNERNGWLKSLRNRGQLTYEDVKLTMPWLTTTACYLTFSNGTETTIIEKDRVTGRVRSSTEFVIATNHDLRTEDRSSADDDTSQFASALGDFIDESESEERSRCMRDNYNGLREAQSDKAQLAAGPAGEVESAAVPTKEDIVQLVQLYPTTNECTHFACVMDPREGAVVWCGRWRKRITNAYAEEKKDVSSLLRGLASGR